ncbi:MAG: restriction endonuclease subunit S [Gammaproteobacteria bacterium]|nr:restriction endonuclease subunit S [Gammaproteobacteria bacterium]
MRWERKHLDVVADFCLGKMLDQKKNRGDLLPYLANVNVRWGEFDLKDLREMRFEHRELDRFGLKYGDIVMCEGGDPGRCAIWKEQIPGMMFQKALHRIRPRECLNKEFLFYLFLHKGRTGHFSPLFTGATIKHLPREKLAKVEVEVPPIPIQERIASILSAYDGLIENNRRRIQLLEKSARLLYKEWFIHLRFPGHERIPVTNGVPEGWERKSLGEVLVYLESGGRPKGGAKEEGIPSIGAENVIGIGQYDYAKEKYVSEEYFSAMRKGVVRSRDIVVYKDGANIGRSSYFGDGFPHKQCAVNEHVFTLRAAPEVGQNLLYFWVAQDETRQHIANLNANTAQPGVSQGKMKTLTFLQPQQAIARLFNETVEPVVRQIFLLARENRMLSQARDLLLPQLMKGDILSPIV